MKDFPQAPRWEVTRRTLDNGLDVIVCPSRRSPMVSVNLWYDVGSQNEKPGQRGFAHLFEHLMFEGSKHYPGDFFKHLQKYGAGVNGSTSSDRTNYYEDIPADILELALAMESDRMGHLVEALDDTRLETQKGVVTNEYRQNYANKPYGMVPRITAEALFPDGHPYSWTTIGLMEEVNAATRGEVVAFFEQFYVPANASLCIAGNVGDDEAYDLADRYFGGFRAGVRCPVPEVPENMLAEERRLTVRDKVTLERLHLVWPSVRQLTADEPGLSILGDILSSGRTSRLYKELVVETRLAQDVAAGQWSRELAGQFSVIVTLAPGASADKVRGIVERIIGEIAREGVRPEEVERVRRRRWSGHLFGLERMGGFGGVADRLNAFNLFAGDPDRLWTDALRYREVTADAIARAASAYLVDKPSLTIHVVPQKRTSAEPDRASGVAIGPAKAYRVAEPRQVVVNDRTTLWLLPRRDWPVVAGTIAAMPATALVGMQGTGLAQLHASTVMEGTARRSGPELAEAIESLGSGLTPEVDWDGFHLLFQATAEGLEPTWDLAAEVWREAAFPDADWRRQRDRLITAQKTEVDRAESLAQRAFLKGLFGTGSRFASPLSGSPEGLAALGHHDLTGLRDRLNRPDRLHIAFVGDFDEQAMIDRAAALAEMMGQPHATDAGEDTREPESPDAPKSRLIVVDKPGLLQAVVRMGQRGLTSLDPDRDALILWNLALGGLFTSRLNHVLRETKGLTYGVRSGFDTRRAVPGAFLVASSVQHDRCAEAIEAVRHELFAMLGEHPLTVTELEDARRNRLESTARDDDTCTSVARRLVDTWLAGESASDANDQTERFRQLTLDQVHDAAARRLHPQHWLTVLVADWSKVKAEVETVGFDEVTVLTPAEVLAG
jgi:predicted Zn-dependent peptidase